MSFNLPCPMCSSVIWEGTLSRPVVERPSWVISRAASAKEQKELFNVIGCSHALIYRLSHPIESSERSLTEAKWEVEARRLFDVRTANWSPDKREAWGRVLGFITDPIP